MFDHYMPNVVIEKSDNKLTNRKIKLSTLISYLFKHALLFRLTMKYWKTDDDMSVIKITDLNCKLMDDITKPCNIKMKDSYDIIRRY
ncbi:MAG: hypothetical protein Ta2E_11000 [Mycoplasmoidaceae bacterium]|nr:MAG: hypothetical protein Ta2E_11000 [Mycoplasmoidaceae bacterium]